jgi:hypothetical protein
MGSLKGDRLADGAVRLANDYPKNIIWSPPGTNMWAHRGNRPFEEWLHSAIPLPRAPEEFQRFMSSTNMNCYQWVILAALRSGAIDRPTAIRYYDSIFRVSDKDALKALYGANTPNPIDIKMPENGNGGSDVPIVTGPGVDLAQKGDIMTFNETDHVMAVTDKDSQGLRVASFPAIPWGERAVFSGPANAFEGTFKDFLQGLLKDWAINDVVNGKIKNYIKDRKRILMGTPAFI